MPHSPCGKRLTLHSRSSIRDAVRQGWAWERSSSAMPHSPFGHGLPASAVSSALAPFWDDATPRGAAQPRCSHSPCGSGLTRHSAVKATFAMHRPGSGFSAMPTRNSTHYTAHPIARYDSPHHGARSFESDTSCPPRTSRARDLLPPSRPLRPDADHRGQCAPLRTADSAAPME